MVIRHPITLKEAARVLRLRYQVVKRMAQRQLIRAEITADPDSVRGRHRYVIDADDLPRVRRVKPWRTGAMRRFRYP